MIFRTLVLKLHKFSNTMNLEGRGCTMDYFKRTLNELRESAGFNQAELADILEVSPKTLWLYEQDSTNIPDELIKKYMYLFDVPYEDIFLDLSTKNSYR